ncbi:DUF6263 family protein [Sphingobacterium sp. SYP-B4668]|uniref:DUF6263 family protein n=1 Tax=Sphingobacterium sp. SYP-B4668 TaxID=2996035 RepID=UPI0022DDEC37|nr:DUF6263 family protein [Sphingobacterium sp. SYP-B4668]
MKKSLLLLLTGSFLTLSAFAQKPVTLRANPPIGKIIQMDMGLKTDVDGPQSIIMDMKMKMEVNPKELAEEQITLETTARSIKAQINAGMMTLDYDSEKEQTDEMGKMLAQQFASILNKTIISTMTTRGKVIDVVLPDNIGQQIDKNSFTNISTTFPETPVKIGDSWESEVESGELFAKIITTSTFKEETSEGYKIDISAKVLNEASEQIGSTLGYYLIDKESNMTKKAQLTTAVQVEDNKVITEINITNTL